MPGNTIISAEEVIAISDPGEKNRDEHVWGDRLVIRIGNVAAWLFPILMIGIVTQVIIRKFGMNQAWLDDAQWWLYGAAMLTAFGYAITTESHVRVDIFHQSYSPAKKAKIEIFALGWLFLPFLVLMLDIMTHYAISSWTAGEGSDSPNGLHRLYLLKALLPILFGVAIIATLAVLQRHLRKLTTPNAWKYVIAAFPALWFIAERVVYYAFWWFTRITQSELNPRRISREPLMDNTLWMGLVVVALVFAVTYFAAKRKAENA
jgi:TRAP-type mannitol/chloroaromatic compound transport system permease small subunit